MQISGVNNPIEAAKWGKTPLIQQKAAVASQNAMTDEYIARLQEQARKDAQRGVGQSEEAIQLQHAQMAKYVSPDRSGAMAQMSQELAKAAREHQEQDPTLEYMDKILEQLKKLPKERISRSFSGLSGGCSGDLDSTPENQVATVYTPDGEMMANYNTSSGGWQILTTQAENQFLLKSGRLYAQFYKEASAEIKAGGVQGAASSGIRTQGKDNAVENMDTFVSDAGEYKVTQRTTKLTGEMAASLAKKYDVKHMTRNEYGSLLKDLRDSGVISSQDFSVGYGGAVPYLGPTGMTAGVPEDASLPKWPLGREKADFTALIRSYAQYCQNFEYPQGGGKDLSSSMAGSYNNILEAFEQIDKFR